MPVLTAISVAKLKPKARRYEVRDTRSSLRLIVFPSGAKSWIMRFRRPDGRSAKLTLGPVHTEGETEGAPVIGGPLTLAGARKLAAEIDLQRASGRDPAADRMAAKRRVPDDAGLTFAVAAQRFISEYAAKRTRRWIITARMLGLDPDGSLRPKGLAERWVDRPVGTIEGQDIHGVVEEAHKQGVPGTRRISDGNTDILARLMHATLSKMFSWLLSRREVTDNPVRGVAQPEHSEPRERVLADREIVAFWKACDQIASPLGAIFKVMLLTGARRQEVAGMTWVELNRDAAMWELPGTRTKNKRPHRVPLSALVREVITALPKGDGGNYVFSLNNGRTPVGDFSAVKRRLDAAMPGVQPWRRHDLRRTAVTGMGELGIRPDVIELVVNHISGHRGGIAGVYNKSELLPERTAALQRWADHVAGLVSGGTDNVVPLHQRQAGAA